MSNQELRGAVIGCGYFARNHLHAWQEVDGARIVALADRRIERARELAAVFAIDTVDDDAARLLARGDFDFVDIVTTPESHRGLVEIAASRGVAVICQKPMAPSMDDARAMVDACARSGVSFFVHENFRWQYPMRALHAASRDIGPLHYARLSFRSGFDIYARQPYLANDERFILCDLGVHLLDLVRFFLGEVERLSCETRRVNPRIRGEDLATLLVRTRGGATAVVELSFASKPVAEHFPQTLVILEGRDGTAELAPSYRLVTRSPGGVDERDVAPPRRAWATPPGDVIQDSVVATCQHWVDCTRAGVDAETTGADNLRTLELVFGAYESAASGSPFFPAANR